MVSLEKAFNQIYHMSPMEIKRKFQYIGEGISRKVYAVNGDYVIKVAKGEEGIYQNQVEHYVYRHSGSTYRKYLCPILWYRPKMLVMPRAVPLQSLIKDKFIDIRKLRQEKSALEDLKALSRHFYLFYEDIESTSSWGIVKNELVLIDYGCTSEEGDRYYDRLFYY